MRQDMGPEEPEDPDGRDEAIARLIRTAGRRAAVPEERARRVRDNVRARWRERTVSGRRRSWTWLGLAAAAALLIAVGAALWPRPPLPSPGPAGRLLRRTRRA